MADLKLGQFSSITPPSGSVPKPKSSPPAPPRSLETHSAPTDLVQFSPDPPATKTTEPLPAAPTKTEAQRIDPHQPLVVFDDTLTIQSGTPSQASLLEVEGMGLIAGATQPAHSEPKNTGGGVQDTFYHHVDWSGFSGKETTQAGVDVIRGGRLNAARGRFTIDTWHGGLHGPPRPGQVTLVFAPDMNAQQRATDIYQRTTGSGLNLTTDRHLEGVLYNGREIPPDLQKAVAQLNANRVECGEQPVDLLPWKDFEDAWNA
jgi:hypothetical protein